MTEKDLATDFSNALAAAGWSTTRRVDTADAVAAWERKGYVVSEAAVEFAASFDGIGLEYARTFPPGDQTIDSCVLDAEQGTAAIFVLAVREYEARIGETLCPVGIAESGHLVLMIGPSGKVFGGYDQFLACYGNSGYEAIRRIFTRARGEPVP